MSDPYDAKIKGGKTLNDNLNNFEDQWLKNNLESYKEDLHTNYDIRNSIVHQKNKNSVAIRVDQYDLYHIHTHEPYMNLSIFTDLGLMNISFEHSDIRCALELNPDILITQFKTLSFDEIEQMMTYIQFTQTDLYANNLEPAPKFSVIKESPFYHKYLHVLVAIQYCLASIAELHI